MLLRAIPVLPSLDLARTRDFYVATLGFEVRVDLDNLVGVTRDGVELHFWPCTDPELPRNSGCRIEIVDIAPLYAQAVAHGIVHPRAPLATKPWGFREFAINDPDRNLVTFAEEVA